MSRTPARIVIYSNALGSGTWPYGAWSYITTDTPELLSLFTMCPSQKVAGPNWQLYLHPYQKSD